MARNKICTKCNKPMRLFIERVAGMHTKCAREIVNQMTHTLKDPGKVEQVKTQCKEKGLTDQEIDQEINKLNGIVEDE